MAQTVSVEITNTRVVRVRVSGAEVLTPKYRHGELNPTEIRIAYNQSGGAPWTVREVSVMGGISTRLGKHVAAHTETIEDLGGAPDWVREFVARYMPGSDPR